MEPLIGTAGGAGNYVSETDTANFSTDVIQVSREVPVIVDFWAPWCGPCKQLGPIIEKAVNNAGGAVRLVKVNIDENQELAQQLRIQSIPAVYAFAGGRPVDGFVGAQPESQIKAFIDRVVKQSGGITGPSPVDEALEQAEEALAAGDAQTAASIYSQVLQHVPENTKAIAGIARCYIATGQFDAVRRTLDQLPEKTRMEGDIQAVENALALAEEAAAAEGKLPEMERRLAADPNDHEARYEMSVALFARGDAEAAMDGLMDIMRRKRGWNEDAARKQLVKIFDALGPNDPRTIEGRQKLSSILFS